MSLDDDTPITITDKSVPVDSDKELLKWDGNRAHILGLLAETSKHYKRVGLFQPYIEHRAVLLSSGRLAVDSVLSAQFTGGLLTDEHSIEGAEGPCPPTPERIVNYNARMAATGSAAFNPATPVPDIVTKNLIQNAFAVRKEGADFLASLAHVFGGTVESNDLLDEAAGDGSKFIAILKREAGLAEPDDISVSMSERTRIVSSGISGEIDDEKLGHDPACTLMAKDQSAQILVTAQSLLFTDIVELCVCLGYQWPAASSTQMLQRCDGATQPPQHSPKVALGVVAVDSQLSRRLRQVSRKLWLPNLPPDFLVRFVLRADKRKRSLSEAAEHRDVLVIAPGPSGMPVQPRSAPLFSLLSWWHCALALWPSANLIGKADDDTWIDPIGVRTSLHESMVEGQRRAQDMAAALYWGIMETFHWRESAHQIAEIDAKGQRGFKYKFSEHQCRVQRISANLSKFKGFRGCPPRTGGESIVGPFPFAKGPLSFLSAPIVSAVLSSEWAMQDALATMQPTSTFGYTRHDGSPTACDDLPAYEDAWTGMALARVASNASGALTYMHVGLHAFSEQASGRYSARVGQLTLFAHAHSSTIVLKDRSKWPFSPAFLEATHMRMATLRRLAPPPSNHTFSCYAHTHRSCNGAAWRRCAATAQPSSSISVRRTATVATAAPRSPGKRPHNSSASGRRLAQTAEGLNEPPPRAIVWSHPYDPATRRLNLSWMYLPFVQTVARGLEAVGYSVRVGSFRGVALQEAIRSLRCGDTFVWVAPMSKHHVPWAALTSKGVRAVYYQTEPGCAWECLWHSGCRAPRNVTEVCDYSLANIQRCTAFLHRMSAAERRSLGAPSTFRHVPPGYMQLPELETPGGGGRAVDMMARRLVTSSAPLVFMKTRVGIL